ncbi:UTP--glucose-1-phosphate uridylyltransferase-domain-containing protein [Cokeromyces recurvatus]|uniref:UTP--glucose-1-phosphate uridylyltransferase-domain-containing protein n=1 Tax=Cokeromyces recurvatus TaxID=90255 RepID=UPI00222094DB|nr:UTP--glucose-1-phosphate uridylyltransferase-domain-containing protein [Cokeromyces recurvatus]KAI7904346.1 UTP--glucose-1-phosphate uridylyltransferase-domain-containing protein [Cokeromyces recurvatus]
MTISIKPLTHVINKNDNQSNNDRQHPPTPSTLDFHGASLAAAAKIMKTELAKLGSSLKDAEEHRIFNFEMDNFYMLFTRYLNEKSKGSKQNWEKIQSPSTEQIIPYASLPINSSAFDLTKLAVLKLNGGLGTTMGCVGPKSVIEVRDNMTFLDLSVRQIEYLNKKHGVSVPFILMNSFNTDEDTKRIVQKYTSHNVDIITFNQSRHPRIKKETLLPVPRSHDSPIEEWYPPGHGDMYESLYNSGLLDQLLAKGKEYLFVSNIDNLGATVDINILNYMVESGAEFIMEVTDKTKADIKGGTLIDYNGKLRLLEMAQVPDEHLEDFKSIKKFKIFNTNNLWINLRAIKRVLDEAIMDLETIVNHKTTESGEKVIQLETAAGAAIKHFKNAHGINVPRTRFLPVKSTSDLFLVTSNLYSLVHGQLIMNPKRLFSIVPLIKLGEDFKKVQGFLQRFKSIPNILDLDHLTVTGDVTFGSNVELRGTVIIVANHGERIDIPSGSVLENKVITGNLRILDH